MLRLIVNIILFFTLIYPIAMSFIWMLGAMRYSRKRRKEINDRSDDVVMHNYTVVIPVYNEGTHIREILLKNLKNSYPNLKFWVINDCSTDNTKAVLDSVSDSRLTVTHLDKNLGKAGVLNYAIKSIDTKFFICLDSDSLAYPDAYEVLNSQINFESDDNIAAYAGSLTVDQENETSNLLKIQKLEYRSIIAMIKRTQDAIFKNILTVSGAFVAYNTEIIKEIGGFDETNATEDIEITWRLTTKGYRAKFLDDFVAEVHSPSVSRNLISQRIRWNLGGLQTSRRYRNLLFKPGFIAHKLFLIERLFSVFWIYSFIFTEVIIALKLLINFPSSTSLEVLVLPTLAILLTGLLLQIVAYRLDKGCKEYLDEFLGLILIYPLAYWFIQPIGYFGALKRFYFNKKDFGRWREEHKRSVRIRKVFSSFIDLTVFFTIYHIVRFVMFELLIYLPKNFVVVHYLLIAFWMVIAILVYGYFLTVNYSSLGEGILGIKSQRSRTVIYNLTNPVVLIIIIDLVFNFSYTIQLIQIDDYSRLLDLITQRVSQGGIVAPVLFIPFAFALLERYLGIMEKLWRNRLTVKR